MGVKNMFKKSSKLFDKEGFYIVLFVCLCIVAVAAVYMSRANSARRLTDNKTIEQNKPTDADLVNGKDGKGVVATSGKTSNNKGTKSTSTKTGSSASTSTSTSFKIDMPVQGEISQEMGYNELSMVWIPALEQWETHPAIDIIAELNAEVKASQSGKVEDVILEDIIVDDSERTGYGVTVIINHNNGFKTVYSNLSSEVKVKKGETIKKGQTIGFVGDTSSREAASEGSHLHFALLKKDKNNQYVEVDPTKYLSVKKQ